MKSAPDDTIEPLRPPASGPGPLSLGLFLAFAVILFGAILTGYALLRVSNPGAFTWAPSLLNRRLGVGTAATLVVTCLAAAGAFRFSLVAKVVEARRLLAVALVAGAAVLAMRAIEFKATSRRAGFLSERAEVASKTSRSEPRAAVTQVGDAAQGKRVFLGTCAACHAPDGSGVKGQGQNLRDSGFLKDKSDDAALAFVKAGRQPFDPESKLHLSMPARGGNPALSDASLLDAIAYVRELEKQAAVIALAPSGAVASAVRATSATSPDQPQVVDGELWLPHSILPAAPTGPTGLSRAAITLQKPGAEGRAESSVRRFFSLLLVVNGLHTVYLLFGLAFSIWLLVATARGGAPGIPLAMVAAYWVVIGAIGLLLIPAFYV